MPQVRLLLVLYHIRFHLNVKHKELKEYKLQLVYYYKGRFLSYIMCVCKILQFYKFVS